MSKIRYLVEAKFTDEGWVELNRFETLDCATAYMDLIYSGSHIVASRLSIESTTTGVICVKEYL